MRKPVFFLQQTRANYRNISDALMGITITTVGGTRRSAQPSVVLVGARPCFYKNWTADITASTRPERRCLRKRDRGASCKPEKLSSGRYRRSLDSYSTRDATDAGQAWHLRDQFFQGSRAFSSFKRSHGWHGRRLLMVKAVGTDELALEIVDGVSETESSVRNDYDESEVNQTCRRSLQERLRISDEEALTLWRRVGHARTKGPPTVEGSDEDIASRPVHNFKCSGILALYILDNFNSDQVEVKKAVLRYPGPLLSKLTNHPKVAVWLEANCGLSKARISKIFLSFPELGNLGVESCLVPKFRWLRHNLSLDNAAAAKMICASPQLLGLSLKKTLEPRLMWMHQRFGLTVKKTSKIVSSCPRLLTLNVDTKMEPLLFWLVTRLGITDEQAVELAVAAPTILAMSPNTGLEPKISWLQARLLMTPEEIVTLLRRYPLIFRKSVEGCLEPKAAWIQNSLRLDVEGAKTLLLRCPNLLGASLDLNLKIKVSWIREKLGMTEDNTVDLLVRCPQLLIVSAEKNLEPTFTFFREKMGASTADLRSAINCNPRLFLSSLSGRLTPRAQKLHAVGVTLAFQSHSAILTSWSETKFNDFVDRRKTNATS